MEQIYRRVRESAYQIIEEKGATYYGVAMAVTRIAAALIRDEGAVLPVSSLMQGEYGLSDLCISAGNCWRRWCAAGVGNSVK